MDEYQNHAQEALIGDILIGLLKAYDLSKIEIGLLVFDNSVTEDEYYYYIGTVEVDLLVINKHSGIIQVLEYDQPSHVLWDCARDSSSFLEALLVLN